MQFESFTESTEFSALQPPAIAFKPPENIASIFLPQF